MLAIDFKYQAALVLPLVLVLPLWRLRAPGGDRRRVLGNCRDNVVYLAAFFFWLLAIYPATEADNVPNWVAPTGSVGLPDWATLKHNLHLTLDAFWSTPGIVAGCVGLGVLFWAPAPRRVDRFNLAGVALSAAAWWIGVSFFGSQEIRQFVALGVLVTVLLAAGLAGWSVAVNAGLSRLHGLPARLRRLPVGEGMVAALVCVASVPLLLDAIENAREHTLPDRRNDLAEYKFPDAGRLHQRP